MKVIRILLLKIGNQSMENINTILEKNHWNLTRSSGDGHYPLFDTSFQFSSLIVIPFSSTITKVNYFVIGDMYIFIVFL